MAHRDTTLVLPERGVVVVTGDNGAGKSTLVEAAAWSMWGRTVRGTPPWTEGRDCTVSVRTPTVGAVRMRGKRSTKLTWNTVSEPQAPPVEYETATKAQEALELVVGSFERWRRTHLFTSADAWTFGAATDAQRKELLEALLGLHVFDEALLRCRTDLSAAKGRLADARVHHATLTERVAAYEAQQGQLQVVHEGAPTPEALAALQGNVERLRGMVQSATAEIAELSRRRVVLATAGGEHQLAFEVARKRLQGLGNAGECPTCGGTVDDAVRGRLGAALETSQGAIRTAQEASAEELAQVDAELGDLALEVRALNEQLNGAIVHARMGQQAFAAHQRASGGVAQVAQALEAAKVSLATSTAGVAELRREVDTLGATEAVLGLRGVRAQVLDGALKAIEHVANVWLARIATEDLRLTLRSTTEKKGGGSTDTISLEVQGAGAGHGYTGASQGEQRRITVALLLAFAEVASASQGGDLGTLWFDEVFDVLDGAGTEAVCGALATLAEERLVVIVTHSAELVQRLGGARRLHVANGTATWA